MSSTAKKCIYIVAAYLLILIGIAAHAGAQTAAVSASALLHSSNSGGSAVSIRDGAAGVTAAWRKPSICTPNLRTLATIVRVTFG